jgi:predicted alpha/beta-hydrolase family hydrolase
MSADTRVSHAFLQDGPESAGAQLVLAHGAGAPMDSPFMEHIARGLAARAVRVTRFEFPYMAARRSAGRRGGPDPQRVLLASYRQVVEELRARAPSTPLFIGGKSMGGRMASMIADELHVSGLVCLGYPFHPAGKPEQTRVAHLATLQTPALFVQGTRDALGSREDVHGYTLAPSIHIEWIEDGDHDLAPRKRSGFSKEAALAQAIDCIARCMLERV